MKSLTGKGFLCAATLPAVWLILFYAFVSHLRISLGRWPAFGQQLETWPWGFYDQVVRQGASALVGSLYIAAAVLIACLFLRRWRHLSVYSAAYGASVAMAFGAMFLAPHSFLNWFFD